jgi:hypothetical protein
MLEKWKRSTIFCPVIQIKRQLYPEDSHEKGNYLEEIKMNDVQLLPLSIPPVPEVTGSDEQSEDVERGMNYPIDKLTKENKDLRVKGLLADDNSFQSSDDGYSSLIIN